MKKTKVKKVKKIPKYSTGTFAVMADKSGLQPGKITHPASVNILNTLTSAQIAKAGGIDATIAADKGANTYGGYGNTKIPSGLTTGANELIKSTFGIKQNSSLATTMDSTAQGAELGFLVGGPWGALAGAGAGFLLGGFKKAKFDESKATTTGDPRSFVLAGGILNNGNFEDEVRRANAYQNSLVGAERTSLAQLKWANDPANQGMVSTLKEGGVIIGDPSKGLTRVQVDSREVITDEYGNNAVRLPYAEGTDSIPALIQPKRRVFSNKRGYADIAEKIIKGTKEGSLLRQIETNNLAIILEVTKIDKPNKSKVLHAVNGEYNVSKEGKSKKGILRGINWEDSAYKLASVLTPMSDRGEAETTRLRKPDWKAAPVAVDTLNKLQDAQLGYALANYNTAQGGYTAGQQLAARSAAASNLARQRAAIHQWQTEQQNKNIAQNIASYNNYANIVADIANKEIDINAANRAAARNINRQNRASALKAWGQINSDSNKRKMDKLRIAVAAPMFKYGMENYDEMVKMLTDMGLWQ